MKFSLIKIANFFKKILFFNQCSANIEVVSKRIEYLGLNKLLEIFIYLILFFDLSTWTKFEKQIFLLVFF